MRRRRFVVAVLAVGLVFGITLLLDGFNNAINSEVERTIAAFRADSWLVPSGSSGPFTADHLAAEDSETALVHSAPSVRLVGVFALTTELDKGRGGFVGVNVVGVSQPVALRSGRWPRTSRELVANDDLSVGIGRSVTISRRQFTVVGETAHLRYFVGTNVVFMRLVDAQQLFVFGQHVVSGFAVYGAIPGALPKGLVVMTNAQVITSLRRPVKVAASTIAYLDILLWIVAAGIIGTILYMTSLERLRDFAALKAIGARSNQVVIGIAAQALTLAAASAVVAWLAAKVLAPVFPIPVEIPSGAC
jgi:putative ABC transport system permease protein